MIVSDVNTRVRRIFGDEAAVQVTDADIIRWINDGQIEIVKHNEAALEKTDLINLVVNQQEYTLPADLLILRSLRFKYDDMLSFSALKYKKIQEFDEVANGWDGAAYGPSKPVYFTKREGKVILFPTPDTSVTDGLKVLYNQIPVDVVNQSDPLSLPLIYHNTILRYCMWQASLLDEDHEPAMMWRSDFQNDMQMLHNNETSDPVEHYHTITTLVDDL